jgi:hypothetical protein
MFSILHLIFAGIQLGLGLITVRQYRRAPSSYMLIVIANMAGLVYDNIAVAAGAVLGEGDLLKALNVPRFYIHALLTPLVVIYAFGVARRAGLKWAQGRGAHTLFCLLATALAALGAFNDIIRLQLEPAQFQDVTRYVNTAVKGPPIPAIVTILIYVTVGLLLWRARRWPWMGVGGLVMFVAAGAAGRAVTIGNFGEVALMGSAAATEIKPLNKA